MLKKSHIEIWKENIKSRCDGLIVAIFEMTFLLRQVIN